MKQQHFDNANDIQTSQFISEITMSPKLLQWQQLEVQQMSTSFSVCLFVQGTPRHNTAACGRTFLFSKFEDTSNDSPYIPSDFMFWYWLQHDFSKAEQNKLRFRGTPFCTDSGIVRRNTSAEFTWGNVLIFQIKYAYANRRIMRCIYQKWWTQCVDDNQLSMCAFCTVFM